MSSALPIADVHESAYLDAAGIDVAAATDAGALSVVTKREAYLCPRDPSREVGRLLASLVERERLQHRLLSTIMRDISGRGAAEER